MQTSETRNPGRIVGTEETAAGFGCNCLTRGRTPNPNIRKRHGNLCKDGGAYGAVLYECHNQVISRRKYHRARGIDKCSMKCKKCDWEWCTITIST